MTDPTAKIVGLKDETRVAVEAAWPAPQIQPDDPEFWMKARDRALSLRDAYRALLDEAGDDLLRKLIVDASATAESRVAYADNWISEWGASL